MNMTSITESAVSGWDSIPKNSAAVQSYVGFFLYFILFIVSSSRLLVQCGCGPSKEAEEHGGYSNITDEDNETESGNESEWGGGGIHAGSPNSSGFSSRAASEENGRGWRCCLCCPALPGGKLITLRKIIHASVWLFSLMEMVWYMLQSFEIIAHNNRLDLDNNDGRFPPWLLIFHILAMSPLIFAFTIKTLLWAKPAVNVQWKHILFFLAIQANLALLLQSFYCSNDLYRYAKYNHDGSDWRLDSREYYLWCVFQSALLGANALAVLFFGARLYVQLRRMPGWLRIYRQERRVIVYRLFFISVTCAVLYVFRAAMLIVEVVGLDKYHRDWTEGWLWTATAEWIPNLLSSYMILFAMRNLDKKTPLVQSTTVDRQLSSRWRAFSQNIYGNEEVDDDNSTLQSSLVADRGQEVGNPVQSNFSQQDMEVEWMDDEATSDDSLIIEPPKNAFPPKLVTFSETNLDLV